MSGVLPPDAQVFLGRLTSLDPAALVRLRPAGPDRVALWARLPWGVLVTREIAGAAEQATGDRTVGAADLLAGASPVRNRDAEWLWPLPPPASTVREQIPASALREVASAAAGTLREVAQTGLAGRPVGARVLREALLDHVPIVVPAGEVPAGEALAPDRTTLTGPVEVPQRLVQAVVRMGFLGGPEAPVRVRTAGEWVALAAWYGTAWLPPKTRLLPLRPR